MGHARLGCMWPQHLAILLAGYGTGTGLVLVLGFAALVLRCVAGDGTDGPGWTCRMETDRPGKKKAECGWCLCNGVGYENSR